MISRLRMLAMDASDLDMVLVCDSLELIHFSTKIWQFNVYRGSKSSSKIGWAGCDVAKALIQ